MVKITEKDVSKVRQMQGVMRYANSLINRAWMNLESVSDYGKGDNNRFKGITEIVTGPKLALEIAQSSLLKCIKYIDNVIDLMEKESGEDDHQEIR